MSQSYRAVLARWSTMNRRRNPFGDINRALEQFRRDLEEMTREFEDEWGTSRTGFGKMGIDVADEGDEFVVTADVPGYDKDEIDLRVKDNTLYVRAEHEQETEERDTDYLRSEREHRSMRESVTLPDPVDEEGITATCQNGVLTVHVPKKEPTKAEGQRIEIE